MLLAQESTICNFVSVYFDHRGPYGRGVLDDTITALGSHNRSDMDRSRLNSTGEDQEDDDVSKY